MLKSFALINILMVALMSPLVCAQSHPFETLRGLERFDKSSTLSSKSNSNIVDTSLAIKGVKVGDNILQQAIRLADQGGQLSRIRGGSRSNKIKFSFYQPYEDSRLEQKVELYFDKHNGFIQQATATYFFQDAYKSIAPIRDQTLSAAVEKFGPPLTMQQAYDVSGQQKGEIALEKFITGLKSQNQLHPFGLEYFKGRSISRSSKWVIGEQGFALMHSGFDRCYMWQTNAFSQILTFCFFDKTGASPNSRGVELDLHNFPLNQQIVDLGNPLAKPDISL